MTYKSVLDPRVVDNAVDMMRADPDVSLYDAILAQPNPDSQMWAGVSCIARIGRFETGNIKKLGDARFLEQVYGPNWHEIQGLMGRVFSAAPSEKFEPTPRMVVGAAAAYEAALSSGITRFAHARNADTVGHQAGCKFDDPRMRTVCAHAALAASVRDLVGTGSVFTQEHYDDLTCSGQSHPAGLRLGASETLAVALVPPTVPGTGVHPDGPRILGRYHVREDRRLAACDFRRMGRSRKGVS